MICKRKAHIILITIFSLLVSCLLQAQDNLQKGNRYFSNREYAFAIKHFENHLKSADSFDIKLKLAQCYVATWQVESAEKIFRDIVQHPEVLPRHYLQYGKLLKQTGNYPEAEIWFRKYAAIYPDNKQVHDLIHSCNLINELRDDSLYIVQSININSDQSDFASTFYQNGIVFLSGRFNNNSQPVDGQTGENYLDLYYTEKEKKQYTLPVSFAEIFNSKHHEGPACFSQNQRFIYFTRSKENISLNEQAELSIYTVRFNGKNWDKPELFHFPDHSYSMGHPSLSSDGLLLYFISNMEGGYGGTDIYVCSKQGFSWSPPINLGPVINTPGNEMFPFIANDGYLYFASDGHVGLGGLDIFKSHFDQNSWSHPINLGLPFNSSKNDFAFFIDPNKETGYFSSNRRATTGKSNIYEFTRDTNRLLVLTGNIREAGSKTLLNNVNVVLTTHLSKEGFTQTDSQGNFSFKIVPNQDYSLIISKPGYVTKRILYFANNYKHTQNPHFHIMMDTCRWEKLFGKIVDEFSSRSLDNVKVQIINKVYNISTFTHCNRRGNFVLDIDPQKPYTMIIEKKGFFTKVFKNYRFKKGNRETIKLQRIARNRYIELSNILFANQDWTLSENTKTELDSVGNLLLNNPHITIEISAYTHKDRGHKKNLELCDMRAKEATNYITGMGIARNRIITKSMGYDSKYSQLVMKVIETF